MAGRTEYVIAHPDSNGTVREAKGGKVPSYATWAYYPETAPHHTEGAGWVLMGWSFQKSLMDAQKKALPDLRKYGMKVTATRVLPTR